MCINLSNSLAEMGVIEMSLMVFGDDALLVFSISVAEILNVAVNRGENTPEFPKNVCGTWGS